MSKTTGFVKHAAELISEQNKQANGQEQKWKLSTGQEWSNTNGQGSEVTELSISSKDDYYELIKQSLFWIDVNLMDDTSGWGLLEKEWVIKAHRLELTRDQEKLIKELFHIINDFDSRDTSTLQQFLEKNKGNPDLKAVLDLKVGASEVTLLHILPTILKLNLFNCHTLMNYLLKAGADPNIQDYKGKTPLHYYAVAYHVEKEYVDSLVSYGADLNIKDNNGKTPLQIAIDKGNCDVAECFFTEGQKKLYEELNKLIKGTSKFEDGSFQYNVQGVEDLRKFLDKHRNDKDLKVILNIQDSEGNPKVLRDDMYTQVINLLLAAGTTESQIMATEQEADAPYVPHQCLLDTLPNQLRQLNKFVGKISEAGNITELQKVVNEAIMSGVRLNFTKDGGEYFTDYVLERVGQLEKNYEVASSIVCTLISKGAKLNNWCSSDVIDKIELEFKDHKANMIKAHEQYVNRTQKFLKIAKNATSGKLNGAKMDNTVFYLEYSKDSIIDIARIADGARNLGLTHGAVECGRNIIRIDKSEVEIAMQDGKRNYTDLGDNSDIVLTFPTSKGALEVELYPDAQNKDRIKVEVSNQDLLKRLKKCGEEIGKDRLLGGLTVNEAIKQGFFVRSKKLYQSPETLRSSVNSSLGDISLSSPVQESIQQVR